jgi:hypothetical protein
MRGGIGMMDMTAYDSPSLVPPLDTDVIVYWIPGEGEIVAVTDYPSPAPLGIVDSIERDAGGDATRYWIWMLDGCRIALDADTVPQRLTRPA